MSRPIPSARPAPEGGRALGAVLRYFPVLHVLAGAALLFSPAFLVPLAFSMVLEDGAHAAYETGFLVTFVTGLFTFFATRGRHRRELQPRDGFLLVSLVWTVVPAFATIPLLLAIPGTSFTDAYFEAVSGMTTSGATVLAGLDTLEPSVNIWRTLLVWIGGMGIIVLAVAILPLLGVGGSQLFKAESPGCMKDTKLTPRIGDTAKGLWGVYSAVTAVCMVSFHLAGMTWIDAVIHAFSTMGLGGFSSHDASFAFFNSPAIEAVTTLFMLAASLNFATHFLVVRRRSFRPYARDAEARRVIVWMVGSSLGIAAFLVAKGTYPDFATAFRHASFNVVSIASTTGFSSVDFAQWPVFAPLWMIFLSCFATSSGSTGGGIKMVRAVVLFKQAIREMTRIIHPRAVLPVKFGEQVIGNNVIFAVLAFMLMYGGTVIVMTMLLIATDLDPLTAITAVLACINNMGPGLGAVGPSTTYAVLTDFQTWVCTMTMLLGRLELFTMLVLFTPAFWRK
ncbi:MAG: TrkH family potassium uptake protein [Betaproteobacteria bacterium]|nr:TrkH family potassium uptake protein [Betaproteobacteria bacterium]